MTAETSNARGEWVLVPRELLEAAVCPMKESGCDGTQYPVQPYGEGEQCQWCCERRASLTAPPPAAAEPKTLPVPTRVYLTDKAAVIVGDPQRGWDEEGPEAHNCDDMGCSTIGPHVLARVPFTDERALSQQPEARGVVDEGSRIVTSQLLHWGGIPVRVTGTVTTSPGNWPLIDASLTGESNE